MRKAFPVQVVFAIRHKSTQWTDLQICNNASSGSDLLAAGCCAQFSASGDRTTEE